MHILIFYLYILIQNMLNVAAEIPCSKKNKDKKKTIL